MRGVQAALRNNVYACASLRPASVSTQRRSLQYFLLLWDSLRRILMHETAEGAAACACTCIADSSKFATMSLRNKGFPCLVDAPSYTLVWTPARPTACLPCTCLLSVLLVGLPACSRFLPSSLPFLLLSFLPSPPRSPAFSHFGCCLACSLAHSLLGCLLACLPDRLFCFGLFALLRCTRLPIFPQFACLLALWLTCLRARRLPTCLLACLAACLLACSLAAWLPSWHAVSRCRLH
jgi:hypothetical protein